VTLEEPEVLTAGTEVAARAPGRGSARTVASRLSRSAKDPPIAAWPGLERGLACIGPMCMDLWTYIPVGRAKSRPSPAAAPSGTRRWVLIYEAIDVGAELLVVDIAHAGKCRDGHLSRHESASANWRGVAHASQLSLCDLAHARAQRSSGATGGSRSIPSDPLGSPGAGHGLRRPQLRGAQAVQAWADGALPVGW